MKEKLIIRWFFIRYSDPKSHLRLRFQLLNNSNFEIVCEKLNHSLKDFINSGEISNVVIDSYTREIERYGENTIEYAEELFYKSSCLVLNFLKYDDEEKIIVSMFYIDRLMSEINLSNEDKLKWISGFNEAFKKEFNADKNLNSQLDKKFRSYKPKYIEFTDSIEFQELRNLILSNISECTICFEMVIYFKNKNLLKVCLVQYFQNIFHVHFNRIFTSNQRLFEMVIYNFLSRYYKSLIDRQINNIM